MMLWFRDADGNPDAVLTFSLLAVVTVLFKILFAGAVVTLPHFTFTIVAPDAASIGAVLLPTLGAYVSNKYVHFNYHPTYKKMMIDTDGDGVKEEVQVLAEEKKV
jgi:hypothetical protein